MDDLLSEFLTETSESLDALDTQLITLEKDPNDAETLNNIFRMVHTVKGTCGFLGLPRLESVAHAAENILGKFRDGELPVTGDSVTLILESIDTIKGLLLVLEETESEPTGSDADLIARLNVAAGMGDTASAPEPAPEPVKAPAADAEIGANIVSSTDSAELDALEAAFQAAPGPDEIAAQEAEETPVEEVEEVVADVPAAIEAVTNGPAGEAAEGVKKESAIANQSIRVSVDLLENLMNMVSELVLTRNQLLQMVRRLDDSEFAVPLQRLSHCTTELQEGVMQTRMQPIGNAWSKLPRIIRDLSNELDKKIELVMNGAETELDRQVLELIKDPLTHMVRNSADHGLETPEQRVAAGKPVTGKVELNAYHEGGHIIIEINDDGRGLAVDKIKQKAIENELMTEAEADGMSDHQIQQFVMRAGFSTAAKVTSVSGRGVGMDVVRSNIEKIGGTIDFKSVEGKGTHFTIKIPLTLAIVAALIVESGAERFAIPQLSVVELVRASADSEHRIETINDTPVLRLRDRLLPLIRLDQVLGLEPNVIEQVATDAAEQIEHTEVEDIDESESASEGASGKILDETSDDVSFVVVTQAGAVSFGLLVDRVFDSEEIVVKPVSPILREIGVFSGNTILGDGSVIMILDPNGLSASVGAEAAAETSMELGADVVKVAGEEEVSILVFRAGSEEPKSVPLALVARLEEIAVEDMEQTESGYVVQYRGQLMPLVMGDPACQFKESGRQPVLVFADERHTMGLVVDEIIDIVDQVLNVELVSSRQGIVGTAVIDGKATEVLDVAHFLTDAFDDWFVGADNSGGPSSGEPCKVLVVDDSPFFRSMLMPVLTVAGYKPMAVESPAAALKLRDQGQTFSLIISDIEMPDMDGFEFAQEVKTSGAWQNTPMVALSSRSMQQDFDRGREVGFDDYVTKFDRDTLLATITQTLSAAAGDSA